LLSIIPTLLRSTRFPYTTLFRSMCAKLKGSLRIVFFAWKRASGAPGEIRTPDLLLRSVNQESSNPVARLAFLQISRTPFGEFRPDRKSTRLNSSHLEIWYAVFCL